MGVWDMIPLWRVTTWTMRCGFFVSLMDDGCKFFLFLCFFATGPATCRPYTVKTHTEAYNEKDLFVSDERHDLCVGLSFLKGRQGISGTFLVHLFQLKQQPDRVHGR